MRENEKCSPRSSVIATFFNYEICWKRGIAAIFHILLLIIDSSWEVYWYSETRSKDDVTRIRGVTNTLSDKLFRWLDVEEDLENQSQRKLVRAASKYWNEISPLIQRFIDSTLSYHPSRELRERERERAERRISDYTDAHAAELSVISSRRGLLCLPRVTERSVRRLFKCKRYRDVKSTIKKVTRLNSRNCITL